MFRLGIISTRCEKLPNNEIEVNTVAFVKITFEPVFVLAIEGNVATVRRGVVAQTGSYYTTTEFTLPELTPNDPSRDKFEKLFKTEDGEISFAASPSPDDSLLQN